MSSRGPIGANRHPPKRSRGVVGMFVSHINNPLKHQRHVTPYHHLVFQIYPVRPVDVLYSAEPARKRSTHAVVTMLIITSPRMMGNFGAGLPPAGEHL